MGWMQKCYETYENNKHMVGMPVEGKATLSPLFFLANKAQIEVTITETGEFYESKSVPKNDADTLIPMTEKSASRSSGIAAHPLCDQLQYVAMGSEAYPDSKEYRGKYDDYMSNLKEWADCGYKKVSAVYNYCFSGTLISDLCRSGVVTCGADGRLTSGKIEGTPYEKCLVRWRVLCSEGDGDSSTWQDEAIFDSYRTYYISRQREAKRGLCYVTGKDSVISESHPKGTLRMYYGAKLISSNDASGFTFKGRFTDSEEALTVGEEVTQKAHSALRWLAANQGVMYGGRAFICWNPRGKTVPALDIYGSLGLLDSGGNDFPLTMPEYKKRLYDALSGYRQDFEDSDDVQIIALDAATTGRLSITYYNELKASDFLDRLRFWGESCCWFFTAFTNDKKPFLTIRTPVIYRIVNAAFGTQQGDLLKCDEKVMKEHSQRILHCIIDRQPVPTDIVRALVRRASTPQSYNRTNYGTILSIACAMVRKHRIQKHESEEWKMDLDLENKNRSYLFGRLLAVSERVERQTYTRDDGDREPNAIRLQAAFTQHPMRTWSILEKALLPYYAKLNPGSRKFYKDLIAEIVVRLSNEDYAQLNKALEDVYLLGYYLQRREFNNFSKNEKQEDKSHDTASEQN